MICIALFCAFALPLPREKDIQVDRHEKPGRHTP